LCASKSREFKKKTLKTSKQSNTSGPTPYPATLIQGETNKQTCRKKKEKEEEENGRE
jgi:hypothetical protein